MNVEIGAEAALFPENKYINGIAVAVCLYATEYVGGIARLYRFFKLYWYWSAWISI